METVETLRVLQVDVAGFVRAMALILEQLMMLIQLLMFFYRNPARNLYLICDNLLRILGYLLYAACYLIFIVLDTIVANLDGILHLGDIAVRTELSLPIDRVADLLVAAADGELGEAEGDEEEV